MSMQDIKIKQEPGEGSGLLRNVTVTVVTVDPSSFGPQRFEPAPLVEPKTETAKTAQS